MGLSAIPFLSARRSRRPRQQGVTAMRNQNLITTIGLSYDAQLWLQGSAVCSAGHAIEPGVGYVWRLTH